ncbi:hypothetical protein OG930_41160 [Streptomyces sp. NBC_01799]|nr:hypothetical protein OG930_41160 [Streptomyces sp. NBC_01799]
MAMPHQAGEGTRKVAGFHPPGEEIQFDWLELPDAPDALMGGEASHRYPNPE